jgi:hypothetical protein
LAHSPSFPLNILLNPATRPATIARGQTNRDATHIRIRLRNHLARKAAEADRYTDQYTIPFKIDDNVAMIDKIIHRS